MEAVFRARRERDIGRKLPIADKSSAPTEKTDEASPAEQPAVKPSEPAPSPDQSPGTGDGRANPSEKTSPSAATPAEPPNSGEDLQLRRAVEYLETKLAGTALAVHLSSHCTYCRVSNSL